MDAYQTCIQARLIRIRLPFLRYKIGLFERSQTGRGVGIKFHQIFLGGFTLGQCKLPGTAKRAGPMLGPIFHPPKKEPGRGSRSMQDSFCMARLVDF